MKLSLPRASSLNENVDHSALLKLGATVSERVNRFDSKPGGEGAASAVGFSKLQETRRIFEQRTLQVRKILVFQTSVSQAAFAFYPVQIYPVQLVLDKDSLLEVTTVLSWYQSPEGRLLH